MTFQRVLAVAPHTDDVELGAGGTLAKLIEQGADIHVVAFSSAADSLPAHLPRDLLSKEFEDATRALGVKDANRTLLDLPVRTMPARRQEILDSLIALRRRIQPDLVLVPASTDVHQDHQAVRAEAIRAFKETSLLGYELTWNTPTFTSSAIVGLSATHLATKWKALTCYRSQIELGRSYFTWPLIEGLARVRGAAIRTEYAEAFEVFRVRM